MNQIAFIFRQAPYGSASGREGLDAMLATSAYSENLAAFFMDDGVYQLVQQQQATAILAKDHSAMFKLCALYDIENIYVSAESLAEREITSDQLLMPVTMLTQDDFYDQLLTYQIKLMF
nr:sulfurtransferase complex subunit TusC [uncultured Tolumonas sp.]